MAAGPPDRRRRLPLLVWIGVAVVAVHALFFWAVWNRHFLPRVPPPPMPTPVNFGARRSQSVDPRTGETVVESDFTVSTHLVTPPSSPGPARSR